MSCTVFAVPFALYWVVGTLVTSVTVSASSEIKNKTDVNRSTEGFVCDEINMITEEHFIEKDFETPFMDKDILLKTLNEHGVNDLNVHDNIINCKTDGYELTFTKNEENKPYNLKITSNHADNAEEKFDNLNSEYAMNVQEDAYLHILDKLKENSMSIESEEVQEDNTIVLTINVEN